MKKTGLFAMMLAKTTFLALLAGILISCGSSKTQKTPENPAPEWLQNKPQTGSYYVGIGHSNKSGTNNYVQEAKKSALEDLVSEIKVNVSSTSVLTQIDQNKEFMEKYEQMIQTTAADEVEEFEVVDTWQDDRNYWVYYRLSKMRYKEIKDRQKRDAVTLALDFFTKARQAERENNQVLALGFYFQGFKAVEKYLADPITLTFEGKEIILTNEIFASMQKLLDGIQITVAPASIQVNRRIATSGQAVMATAHDKGSKRPLVELPLHAAFEKGAGDVFPTYKTDASGQAKILISKIGARDLEQSVAVKVDLIAFAGENPSEIFKLVAGRMTLPVATVLMAVKRPLVYLQGDEKSFGKARTSSQIGNKIRNYLTAQGFEFTDEKSKAELLLDVASDAEKGAVSGSIHISYVTTVLHVRQAADNKEIYTTTLDRVKGYSLDFDRASQEAYNQSLELLDKEKLPELLNAILQ